MRLPCLVALGLLASFCPPSQAARSYDNCSGFVDTLPAVISSQGTWCLRKDLGTAISDGAAIEITANNVTLDCNDFKLGGLTAGPGTLAVGVGAGQRLNITVRNCNIRGFHRGIRLSDQGAGHRIEDNRFEGITLTAVSLYASNSTIRGNHLIETGGSNVFNPLANQAVFASGDGNVILDNTITGIRASDSATTLVGIQASGDVLVARNRVSGLQEATTAAARGISVSNGRAVVQDNLLIGPVEAGSRTGIACGDNLSIARNNTMLGFDAAASGCTTNANLAIGN